jgi:hypothetical protein
LLFCLHGKGPGHSKHAVIATQVATDDRTKRLDSRHNFTIKHHICDQVDELCLDLLSLSVQVRLLQQIQMQHQELLLSHAQMLARWQELHTRSSEFSAGFDVCSPAEGIAAVLGRLKRGWDSSSSSSSSRSTGPADVAQQSQQQQQEAAANAVGGSSIGKSAWLMSRLWRHNKTNTSSSSSSSGGALQDQFSDHTADKGYQRSLELDQAAAASEATAAGKQLGNVPEQQQQQQQQQRWHMSVRLWLPQWVPEVIEDLDYELTSQQYIQDLEAAAGAAMAAEDEAAEQQQQACW